jgi:hypothetical protein
MEDGRQKRRKGGGGGRGGGEEEKEVLGDINSRPKWFHWKIMQNIQKKLRIKTSVNLL